MVISRRAWILLTAGALALAMAAGPTPAEVFVTSPETGRILVLDGDGTVLRIIGEAGGLVQPYAISVDSQRWILVADYAAGRILRYAPDGSDAAVVATRIPKPDGLSVAPSGDLFLVSRDDRSATPRVRLRDAEDLTIDYLRQVWMIPAGGSTAAQIASIDESTRLAGTAMLASGPYAGDLLVLSTRPGLIARLSRTGGVTFRREVDFATGVPGDPTGIAIMRTGHVLVATSDGRVLVYDDAGRRLSPDFASGLPAGPTRVTVTGDGIVHVTRIGDSAVLRFDAHATPMPQIPLAPYTVGAAINSGCVPTPAGQMVSVSPAAGIQVTFDNVTQAGQTCLVTTALGPGVTTTPQQNVIPPYARKLWEDDGFVVYQLTTTALITDTIASDFFSPNPDARVLHGSGSGVVMEDTTTLVTPEDPRARTKTFSEFVVYLDTRPSDVVILDKLSRLQAELDSLGSTIDPIVRAQIEALVAQAATLIASAAADSDRQGAIQVLKDLKQLVRANSGEAIPNVPGADGGGNVAGGLVALADTLIFSLGV